MLPDDHCCREYTVNRCLGLRPLSGRRSFRQLTQSRNLLLVVHVGFICQAAFRTSEKVRGGHTMISAVALRRAMRPMRKRSRSLATSARASGHFLSHVSV